ncbi:MAG TPA: dihydrodipicolinate synthase family protein [Chloroflexota bacterium]|nr:dihydrodipicolinate synthase family protein [Chloroflexota bacterium]
MPLSPEELRPRLRGVLAFPVTPFNQDFSLNEDAFQSHVDYLIRAGMHAIVAAGGTGELYSMTPAELVRIYRLAVEAADGRVPVIVGVGFNLELARELAREGEKAGADAILVLPHYYGRAEEAGFYEYYAGIARSVGIAVFPYARDAAVLGPELVARLAEIPNIVAFKDGQADLRAWARIRDRVGNKVVWLAGVGDDMVNSYFAAGAEGFTSSAANFIPSVVLELFQAARSGDFARVNSLLCRWIQPIFNIRARRRGYEVTTTKEAMNLLGRFGGRVRPPLAELSETDRADLRAALIQMGLLT